jgi:hypothetical protein
MANTVMIRECVLEERLCATTMTAPGIAKFQQGRARERINFGSQGFITGIFVRTRHLEESVV